MRKIDRSLQKEKGEKIKMKRERERERERGGRNKKVVKKVKENEKGSENVTRVTARKN